MHKQQSVLQANWWNRSLLDPLTTHRWERVFVSLSSTDLVTEGIYFTLLSEQIWLAGHPNYTCLYLKRLKTFMRRSILNLQFHLASLLFKQSAIKPEQQKTWSSKSKWWELRSTNQGKMIPFGTVRNFSFAFAFLHGLAPDPNSLDIKEQLS